MLRDLNFLSFHYKFQKYWWYFGHFGNFKQNWPKLFFQAAIQWQTIDINIDRNGYQRTDIGKRFQ